MPWDIIVLCIGGTRPDGVLFHLLHTDLDTHAAMDLLDLKVIHDSWATAVKFNALENQPQ